MEPRMHIVLEGLPERVQAAADGKRPLKAAYHIGGFCEILGVPEVLGLMSTNASGHYSSPKAGSLSVECS